MAIPTSRNSTYPYNLGQRQLANFCIKHTRKIEPVFRKTFGATFYLNEAYSDFKVPFCHDPWSKG